MAALPPERPGGGGDRGFIRTGLDEFEGRKRKTTLLDTDNAKSRRIMSLFSRAALAAPEGTPLPEEQNTRVRVTALGTGCGRRRQRRCYQRACNKRSTVGVTWFFPKMGGTKCKTADHIARHHRYQGRTVRRTSDSMRGAKP